jgi:hypothetical protein
LQVKSQIAWHNGLSANFSTIELLSPKAISTCCTSDLNWRTQMAQLSEAPAENATPKLKMRYKLKTEEGKAFYRLRKCTVEPVIGIIKEAMGFRQFSLRGSLKVDGEWNLVCLAFNFRRLHVLMGQKIISPTGC